MTQKDNILLKSVCLLILLPVILSEKVCTELWKVWGPGLEPNKIVMPARYFFIESHNCNQERLNSTLSGDISATVQGVTQRGKSCRIHIETLNRKDGSYITRYKVYEQCFDVSIHVKFGNKHIANSPYKISGSLIPDDCNCPIRNLEIMLQQWDCGRLPTQLVNDLNNFSNNINWDLIRNKIIDKYDKPLSISLCHYVIKYNNIHRKCYGKYVGFKMFMDSILLSMSRKAHLPDLEFFVNLGDWPLVPKGEDEQFPIFSWCGSDDTVDITMPTYGITESSIENMGRVMLDMLSVQGNTKGTWDERIPKAFWRGRDSSRERLKLIDISRKHPDLFNCSLTNFFFFRDQESQYGPTTEHVSFYSFFDYKYQLGLDGTVAAYRFPYLLAGGSLIFKQQSKYYEHFYKELEAYKHYIPIKRNLDDLVEKIEWALKEDDEAKKIAENGRNFANAYLLPKNIFCYYGQLFHEFGKKIISTVKVLEDMEKVEQPIPKSICSCDHHKIKEDL